MKKLLQFLQEDNGQFSSARLLAFLSVLSFIIDWHKHTWSGIEFRPDFSLVGFILGIVGVKVVQKFAEQKNNIESKTEMEAQ